MLLSVEQLTARLAGTGRSIQELVLAAPPEQVRWKPAPEKWSILEVVNHLADEEAEDFRARLDLLLHHPGEPWPPIDPRAWVRERRYGERDPGESLARFRSERERSLAWLREIGPPDWERSYSHPQLGVLTAGSIAASWLAHDLLHVRQLARLHWEFVSAGVAPHSAAYAGAW
ncbi:MAG TPA: DinB family protein [Longimicrobiaceae bacterium]|nr:DinB family protein [Longimicrobiaceae bacterium]